MEYLIVFAILAALVVFVTGPVRRAAARSSDAPEEPPDSALAELEAAREAKLRELRDAELDHRTGKLSDSDYEELDRTLRGEAIEIIHDLDREQNGSLPSPRK
jgi:flagellar biosynthesis/type III secretory pathway M-ring protein FliF/YscJ